MWKMRDALKEALSGENGRKNLFLLDYAMAFLRWRRAWMTNDDLQKWEKVIAGKEKTGREVIGLTQAEMLALNRYLAQQTGTEEKIRAWEEKINEARKALA